MPIIKKKKTVGPLRPKGGGALMIPLPVFGPLGCCWVGPDSAEGHLQVYRRESALLLRRRNI